METAHPLRTVSITTAETCTWLRHSDRPHWLVLFVISSMVVGAKSIAPLVLDGSSESSPCGDVDVGGGWRLLFADVEGIYNGSWSHQGRPNKLSAIQLNLLFDPIRTRHCPKRST